MKNNLSSLKEEAVTEVVVAMAEGVVVDTEVVAMEVEVAAMEAVAAVMEVVVGVVATSFAFSLDCILKNVSNMEDNKTLAQLNIDLPFDFQDPRVSFSGLGCCLDLRWIH